MCCEAWFIFHLFVLPSSPLLVCLNSMCCSSQLFLCVVSACVACFSSPCVVYVACCVLQTRYLSFPCVANLILFMFHFHVFHLSAVSTCCIPACVACFSPLCVADLTCILLHLSFIFVLCCPYVLLVSGLLVCSTCLCCMFYLSVLQISPLSAASHWFLSCVGRPYVLLKSGCVAYPTCFCVF